MQEVKKGKLFSVVKEKKENDNFLCRKIFGDRRMRRER